MAIPVQSVSLKPMQQYLRPAAKGHRSPGYGKQADDLLKKQVSGGEEKDMKLIYAIVRNDNEDDVTTALSRAGYSITKLNTTGGFLRKGNVTLMIGTDDEKVDQAIGIIKKECGESQKITIDMPFISGVNMVNYATMPMQVAVGGATIFVTDVVRFEKF